MVSQDVTMRDVDGLENRKLNTLSFLSGLGALVLLCVIGSEAIDENVANVRFTGGSPKLAVCLCGRDG